MTVFVDVYHDSPFPTEEKISEASAEDDRDAEPAIEGHEDEHKEVAYSDLNHVEKCLDDMTKAYNTRSVERKTKMVQGCHHTRHPDR